MHESKEKAKVIGARARTPEPLQSMCIKGVGTRQRTVKRAQRESRQLRTSWSPQERRDAEETAPTSVENAAEFAGVPVIQIATADKFRTRAEGSDEERHRGKQGAVLLGADSTRLPAWLDSLTVHKSPGTQVS